MTMDGHTTGAGVWVYYKLIYEPFAKVSELMTGFFCLSNEPLN